MFRQLIKWLKCVLFIHDLTFHHFNIRKFISQKEYYEVYEIVRCRTCGDKLIKHTTTYSQNIVNICCWNWDIIKKDVFMPNDLRNLVEHCMKTDQIENARK